MIQKASSTPAAAASWPRRALSAPWRGVLLCGPMLAELAVAVMFLMAVALIPVFLGVMVMPGCLLAVRREAERARRLTRRTTGTEIAAWYRPEPSEDGQGGALAYRFTVAAQRPDHLAGSPLALREPDRRLGVDPHPGGVGSLGPVRCGDARYVEADCRRRGQQLVRTHSRHDNFVRLGVRPARGGVRPRRLRRRTGSSGRLRPIRPLAAGTEPPGRTRQAGRATGRKPQRGGRSPSRRDPKDRTRPPRRGAGTAGGHGDDARGRRTTPRA